LLRALQNQDMYLAGSMVMLLSFLTVIGTLISDILLLWLDPRIRYEGKG
jgi:peptide/nickel transport system permease protein